MSRSREAISSAGNTNLIRVIASLAIVAGFLSEEKNLMAGYQFRTRNAWQAFSGTKLLARTRGDLNLQPAPRSLQLYFSYLTEGLRRLLNDTVHKKNFVGSFPQREKFCASMPICSGVRDDSLESFSGLEAALKT